MHLNETVGWFSITAGFASGMLLGLRFHRHDWMGGYASFPRRLVRLGHIAMVALGAINILFVLSLPRMHLDASQLLAAQWGFAIGCITMPIACFLTAWRPGLQPVFVIPVASLLTASVNMCIGVLKS